MKLLYASDYDSQNDVPLSFYDNQRKRFWNGEKDGLYDKMKKRFWNGEKDGLYDNMKFRKDKMIK